MTAAPIGTGRAVDSTGDTSSEPAQPSLLEDFLIAQAQYALTQAFPDAHRILCRAAARLQVLGDARASGTARELAACREILAAFEKRRLRLSITASGQPLILAATKVKAKPGAGAAA